MTSDSCSATQCVKVIAWFFDSLRDCCDISQIVKHLFLISGSQVGRGTGLGDKPWRWFPPLLCYTRRWVLCLR